MMVSDLEAKLGLTIKKGKKDKRSYTLIERDVSRDNVLVDIWQSPTTSTYKVVIPSTDDWGYSWNRVVEIKNRTDAYNLFKKLLSKDLKTEIRNLRKTIDKYD
jgi:hypothetical protein